MDSSVVLQVAATSHLPLPVVSGTLLISHSRSVDVACRKNAGKLIVKDLHSPPLSTRFSFYHHIYAKVTLMKSNSINDELK